MFIIDRGTMHLRSKDSESTAEWTFDRATAAPLDRRPLVKTMALALLPLLLGGACTLASALFPENLLAQAPASPPSTSQSAPAKPAPAAPSLTIDRDPVASPDPQTAAPAQPPVQPPSQGQGTAQKGPGGKFTLREDAYE